MFSYKMVNYCDKDGNSPLVMACLNDNLPMVMRLFNWGARVYSKDKGDFKRAAELLSILQWQEEEAQKSRKNRGAQTTQKSKAQQEQGFQPKASGRANIGNYKDELMVLELERILHCKRDHECLKLTPGTSVEQVRQRFKCIALALHPDKCSLPGAKEAFQRLSDAYDRLNIKSS
ncbi:hypothetical protein DUNSADRAFT_28 [Dunaliella salina]|uniref:J domain-containing protein n=1 Tax=Dunaliella salina TaxID=3046 RepID=A0ABQ7HAV0_DUNSA|nr:hypothetical protein DUNSADRAFT_28 [Dunaliella salina]|eukprot:KAF5843906.1 hypothetical protein DUNSADRAFT_28 [Dunaliella salina]